MEAPTLADIAAVTRDGEGFNGNGSWWVVLLFIILFGAGGFWGNRGDYGQYATAASQQEILFGQQFQNLDNKLDRLGNGICDATYALNNAINGVNGNVAEAKYDNAMRIADTNQLINDKLCGINANIDAKFAALEKTQLEQKIADLQNQINLQNMNAQLSNVVRYPNGYTYTAGQSPFCNCNCNCNGAY